MGKKERRRDEIRRRKLLRKVAKLKSNIVGSYDPNAIIRDLYMPNHSKMMMFGHQLATIARGGLHDPVDGIDFHPAFPFFTMFRIGRARYFRKEAYCFMYYLLDVAKIVVSFNLRTLRRSLAEAYGYPEYHTHLKRFFELFEDLEDWWLTVDGAIGEGHEWGVLLLGRNFTTPKEGTLQTTFEWLQFSKEDQSEQILNDVDQRMLFRRNMLKVNGYDEMTHGALITAEPFAYSDYPADYVCRLQRAINMFENKTSSDSASGLNWTSESSFEY